MIVFAFIAAGLLALALALLLPALLRQPAVPAAATEMEGTGPNARRSNLSILRDQLAQLDADLAAASITAEQHRLSRAEIERRVLDEESVAEGPRKAGSSRSTAIFLGALIPVVVLGLYAAKGNVAALDPQARQAKTNPAAEVTQAQVEDMVDKLAKKLDGQAAPQPGDAQGWTMLARSYGFLQRFPEASRAYSRAIALDPKNAQLLADHADVLAALQGQQLAGEPMRLVEQALAIDPQHPKALALAGSGAFERKDFAGAIAYWSKARQLVPADGEFAQALDGSIAEAKEAAGKTAAPAAPSTAATTATATNPPPMPASAPAAPATATATTDKPGVGTNTSAAQVAGRVSLAPALAARAAPTDTVFIFARAAEGPRVPLAVLRRTVADLPITFKLDDSMAMSPQMKLSNFPMVVVGARISKSGNAMPQPGDLQGQAAPTAVGASGIELVIDSVQP